MRMVINAHVYTKIALRRVQEAHINYFPNKF